jgi:chaperone modulatory protein CbpM
MDAATPLRPEAGNALRMIALEDLLNRLKELDQRELTRWVENRWVLPERRNETLIFHEVDVARIELILDIRHEFAIDDEALPLVLGLLDQVYDLRRQLRRMCDALVAQPPEVQAVIRKALPSLAGPEVPQD